MKQPRYLAFFQQILLRWFGQHGRDLPWRRTRSHYRILVSEIMLQQTQVHHVIPKYLQFLKHFPTAKSLASASPGDVIRLWSGLGYNRRAINLRKTVRILIEKHHGRLPSTLAKLQALPGVGPYTAGALLAFAHHADQATLDTNIRRVIHRFFLGPEFPSLKMPEKNLLAFTQTLIPKQRGWSWNHGLMDFGSVICTAKKPSCDQCPLARHCISALIIHSALRKKTATLIKRHEPSPFSTPNIPNRIYRGRIVELLRREYYSKISLTPHEIGKRIKTDYTKKEEQWLHHLLKNLQKDGLVHLKRKNNGLLVSLPMH